MRMKWIAAVGAAAVLCVSALPAAVAAPAQVTADSLSLAWRNDLQEQISVTWWNSSAVSRVVLQKADGTEEREYDVSNLDHELLVNPADLPIGGVWRFASYAGQELIARTVLFDSDRAVPVTFTKVQAVPGALGITFRVGRAADSTPGDPLDTVSVAAETMRSWCAAELKQTRYRIPSGQPDTDQVIGFSSPSAPSILWLHSNSGFGGQASTRGALNRISIGARTMPRTGTWSQPLTFTASVFGFYQGGCEFGEYDVRPDRVWLQTRKNPADEWRRVTPTSAVVTNGTLTVRTPAIGNSEYRFYAPQQNPAPDTFEYGDETAAVPVTVSTRLLSAKFSDATVTTTQRTTASIWVGPYGSQLATLQYRRSSTAPWAAVVNRKLVSGRVSYTFAWNRRGVTYFRWVVASTTYAGLRVEGKTTGTMILTVR